MMLWPGCCCQTETCPVRVRGCSGFVLGAGIEVRAQQSGSTVATAQTDAAGVAELAVPPGTYDLVVEDLRTTSRWTGPQSFAGRSLSVSSTTEVTLTGPKTGFHCLDGCGEPVKDTLYGTSARYGELLYEWTGASSWIADTVYSTPAYASCAARDDAAVRFRLLSVTNMTGTGGSSSFGQCPGTNLTTGCVALYYGDPAYTCPPEFSWYGQLYHNTFLDPCTEAWYGGPGTYYDEITITEEPPPAMMIGPAAGPGPAARGLVPLAESRRGTLLGLRRCLYASIEGCGCSGAHCHHLGRVVQLRDCLACLPPAPKRNPDDGR